MNNFLKTYIKEIFSIVAKYIVIQIIVCEFWRAIELIFLGYLNPNVVDSIISIILSFSILLNVELLKQSVKK